MQTNPSTELSSSLEDYLEAIHEIIERKGRARVKEIVSHLDVAAPSVTNALTALKKLQLVEHEPYGEITLTPKGNIMANGVRKRHRALKQFFTQVLDVNADTAETCACKMEHAVPELVLERFVAYVAFDASRGSCRSHWVEGKGFEQIEPSH